MTGRPLTVALDPADDRASCLHRTVLASLPDYFRVAAGPDADVQLVSGDQAGWRSRARSVLGAHTRAVMLTGRRALTAEAARSLSRDTAPGGILLGVDTAYASDRSWIAALPLLAADAKEAAVLDSVITVARPDLETGSTDVLRAALMEQLAVVRPLLRDLAGLETVHVSGRNYVLAAVTEGVTITLAGVISGTGDGSLDLHLVGTGRHWQALFEADSLARPATISVSDLGGRHIRPAVFESAHRASWLDLYKAICHETPLPYPASHLEMDLALAEAILPGPEVGSHAGTDFR
jgi:hypothetical protein